MIVRLPVPPSTNNLFVNVRAGGRMLSPAYKAWRTEAGWVLNLARPELFGITPVSINLVVPRKPASRDIDNFLKGPLDLLVAHNVISDDKQIEELIVSRHDDADIILSVVAYGECPTASRIGVQTAAGGGK